VRQSAATMYIDRIYCSRGLSHGLTRRRSGVGDTMSERLIPALRHGSRAARILRASAIVSTRAARRFCSFASRCFSRRSAARCSAGLSMAPMVRKSNLMRISLVIPRRAGDGVGLEAAGMGHDVIDQRGEFVGEQPWRPGPGDVDHARAGVVRGAEHLKGQFHIVAACIVIRERRGAIEMVEVLEQFGHPQRDQGRARLPVATPALPPVCSSGAAVLIGRRRSRPEDFLTVLVRHGGLTICPRRVAAGGTTSTDRSRDRAHGRGWLAQRSRISARVKGRRSPAAFSISPYGVLAGGGRLEVPAPAGP